ncbi:hypothetical protein [Amycolatopsis granulosa]|uniref:hypothetical protein n=1 Tax=Amycolatopsis granulosa TaxID=185684 RepID=UPI00141ECB11|nr:hypothetical protein [Amycolatopsis granulosa]NIH87722.1 hypothetical protein [Amycolatopsis granulosa]
MHLKGIVLAAATGALGLSLFAAPSASATAHRYCVPEPGSTGSCGWINVEPDFVHAGQVVDVEANCVNASGAPESVALENVVPSGVPTHWNATVPAGTAPGTYYAWIICPENAYASAFSVE